MTPRRLRLSAGAVAIAAAVAIGAGIANLSAQPQFRGGVDRVTVDAIVLDKDGAPIRDLTRDDFTLEVDGKPRRVQSAELVSFDRASGTAAITAGAIAPEGLPEITTNAQRTPSRLILLLVDRDSLKASETKAVTGAGIEFVHRLDPADRVGLLAFPGDSPKIEFTRDHRRVIDGLGTILGTAPESTLAKVHVSIAEAFAIDRGEPGALVKAADRSCHGLDGQQLIECRRDVANEAKQMVMTLPNVSQAKLRTLQSLIEALGHIDGPKVVILMSQGIPYGEFMPLEIQTIGTAAARAAISFYAIQMFRPAMDIADTGRPPDLDEDRRLMATSLGNIASASGGALLQPAGKVDVAFQRIARELSSRYVLSFDIEPPDQDGKPHRITLKTARDNTRLLRYRREFTWQPPGTSTEPGTANGNANANVQATLAKLIASGDIRNELPLQVSTFTMPQLQMPGQKTTVWAHIPAASAGTGAGASTPVPATATVRLEVFDEKDVRVVSTAKAIEPASAQAALAGTLDFMTAMALPPGRYVARIAVQDSTGKLGSIEHPFEARVAGTNELRVGSLMLLDEQSVADGRPAPVRSIGSDTNAFRVYIELQAASTASAASPWTTVKGALDIVDPGDGRVRSTIPLSLRETNDATRRIAEAVVPLDGWNAGTYLTRAAIANGGAPIATVTRTIVLDSAHAAASTTATAAARAPGAASPAAKGGAAGVDAIVADGGGYVEQYIARGSSVVAEEHYVQIQRRGPADPKRRNVDPALDWRDDNWTRMRSFEDAKVRRQLISDVLMVKTNNGSWVNFRDVGTVDGKEITDRSKRALELFTKSGVDVGATLQRVAEESSRHDLGRVGNINSPMLPLLVLQPEHRKRFEFGSGGTETIDGVETTVLTYRERTGPSFMRNRQNEDVFISGKLWIAPGDGRVLRTEMVEHNEFTHTTSNIIVTYRTVPELGLLMPVEMWERYTPDRPLDDYVERRARYTNFRRFTVAVSDSANK